MIWKNNKKWEKEEEKFLIEFYPTNGVKFCAEHLNRTERSIVERCKKLKLKMLTEFKNNLHQKYNKEILQKAVEQSLCYADVLRAIGLIPQAGNFKQLKRNLIKFNISVGHFLTPGQLTQLRNKNGTQINKSKDISEYLIIGSTISSDILKKKLYKLELKKPVCEICTQGENWFGKKLVMILDHENGDHFDNRLENLRILCPNCNSTLETNCSKNRKITNKKIDNIIIENKNINFNYIKLSLKDNKNIKLRIDETIEKNCKQCNEKYILKARNQIYCSLKCSSENHRKVSRPTKEQLKELIDNKIPWTKLGEMFGVSDNSVRKWAKKHELVS